MKIISRIETSTTFSLKFDGSHGSYIGMVDLIHYLGDKEYGFKCLTSKRLSKNYKTKQKALEALDNARNLDELFHR